MKAIKYFYILLLIENIKNSENLNLSLDNSSNNTNIVNYFEMNDTFNENHIGIELNLSSFDYLEQDYIFFFHKLERRIAKVSTFRLEFEISSLNDSINAQNFDIKCVITDININLSDIDTINNLNKFSSNDSNCIGSFDLSKKDKNKYKYNGIYKTNSETGNDQKLIFMIRNDWNVIEKVNLFLRTNIDNLPSQEGIIREKEDYTYIPYYFNLSDFENITEQIILYSSRNLLQIYYLNDYISNKTPSLLYKGNAIVLDTNKNIIYSKYNNIKEMILLVSPLENDINDFQKNTSDNYFDIKFLSKKERIEYFFFNDIFPFNKQISLQMIEQNRDYCFIINYQNENNNINVPAFIELYNELIFGKVASLKIYNELNEYSWNELIQKGQILNINEPFYIFNNKSQNNYMNMICATNNNIPSMIHFYFSQKKENDSSPILLRIGDTYATNLINETQLFLNISGFISKDEFTITIHAFNRESKINIEVNFGNDSQKIIESNSIEGLKILIDNEDYKEIKVYNKGMQSCIVIIKIGLQINENEDIKENNIFYNLKYNLYYFKFLKLFEQYKYSKIIVNIISDNDQNNLSILHNNLSKPNYYLTDNFESIILPNLDLFYANDILDYKNKSSFELINPLIIYGERSYKTNSNYYLIIKPNGINENKLKILINYEKYDFNEEIELNSFLISQKNSSGFIIPREGIQKSYLQLLSCSKDNSIFFDIYDNLYKNILIQDFSSSDQFKYYPIEENFIDLSISLKEKQKREINGSIFINYFLTSKIVSANPTTKQFLIEFNNITNSIYITKPNQAKFNYTIYLGKNGTLSDKNINICQIHSQNDLSNFIYYIKDLSDEDFIDNQYKLDFTSLLLKNYKSFDMILYAKEIPFGMHLLSNIITYIEPKKAIIIEDILQKNNENILYYVGQMEKINYYKINTNGNYEFLITIHLGEDYNENKISIDCAQIKSDYLKDIKSAMIEQKYKEICKIIDIKNNNKKIVAVFVKMNKNVYSSLAIRLINENENSDIAIYSDIENLNMKKEIIMDEENEDKLININYPFCFRFYKIYLDDITNNKYSQIGLYSKIKNSISILINNEYDEKILIDYGNLIVINTNNDYIKNNYNQNKELFLIIGDNTKSVLKLSDIDSDPMILNIIGLTKKYSNEKAYKINLIEYYSYKDISNLNNIFVPLYLNKCDNTLNNFIILNIKQDLTINNNSKKYLKIDFDFGDIPLIEYSNILDKVSFKDEINNLLTLKLEERNLILLEDNIYIFKIKCTNYLFMSIKGYEINSKIKKDNYIIKYGSFLNIPLQSQETVNLNLNELIDSNLTKIELLNERNSFEIRIELKFNEIIELSAHNRTLILVKDKYDIKEIKIKVNKGNGYIQISSNINNNELIKEENSDYLSYNNRELYIYPHNIKPNNSLITISIPIINKDKSKYISVCYYISQIIIKNKNINNCFTISENSLENITIINPYNIYDNYAKFYNISNVYIIFYKNGKNTDNKLELKQAIIEQKGKNSEDENGNNIDDNLSKKVGRVVLIIVIVVIVLTVFFFVFIYIRKINIKKKEMNYQAAINSENELLAKGIYNTLY